MTKQRRQRRQLEAAVSGLRLKYGQQAIQRGNASTIARNNPHIATGFPGLDQALTIGGIPRGRMTELIGRPTSGMTTLALKIMVEAQQAGDMVTYIDLDQTFNPDYAYRCQVDLGPDRFLLVRPHRIPAALAIARALIESQAMGLVVYSAPVIPPQAAMIAAQADVDAALRPLVSPLRRSNTALLFLCPSLSSNRQAVPGGYALAHLAALRLLIHKETWIRQQGDIRGYKAQIHIIKNQLGRSGNKAHISIRFNGTVRGDGT